MGSETEWKLERIAERIKRHELQMQTHWIERFSHADFVRLLHRSKQKKFAGVGFMFFERKKEDFTFGCFVQQSFTILL
jgi:hypothetical protein